MYHDFTENSKAVLPNIFENKSPIIELEKPVIAIVSGISGSGKDTILDRMKNDSYFKHLRTATTRHRRYKLLDSKYAGLVESKLNNVDTRESHEALLMQLEVSGILTTEPQDAYIWMRFPNSKEEFENRDLYYANLRDEYKLLESDAHLDNFYGLPKSSIDSILLQDDENTIPFPVIRTDHSGMKTVTDLFSEELSIVNFVILPDSCDQAIAAVVDRQTDIPQDELQKRIIENELAAQIYPDYANFYVKNTRNEINGEPGLEVTIRSMKEIVEGIQGQVI